MKKIMWAAVALTLFAMTSSAQNTPKADVGVGYSYLHLSSNGATANLNGVSGSVAYNANDWLGIAGDFGVYHGSPSGVGFTAVSYLFGPRISVRKMDRAVPFFQALFGGARSSSAGLSQNNFAFSFGGGVDIAFPHHDSIAFRPQFDYVGIRSNGTTINGARVSFGIVYHIGQK